ncbi:hypothetical protein [Halomicrococcus sp. NG-SE-24]
MLWPASPATTVDGSGRNVEPRDWYLRLRRAMGALVMVAGFVLSGGVRYR